jgi:hypothetical protein
MNPVVIEFALHLLPSLRPCIEIDADLVGEFFVDDRRRVFRYGVGHILPVHEASRGFRKQGPLEWVRQKLYYACANASTFKDARRLAIQLTIAHRFLTLITNEPSGIITWPKPIVVFSPISN